MSLGLTKRILILGSSGAGKSTLATALSSRLGLPLIHMDKLVWRPGWVMAQPEDLERDVVQALAKPAWILDSSLRRHWSPCIQSADLIVFLDYPTWLCMFRVLKRIFESWRHVRSDRADGCPEQFDFGFLGWIARWRRHYRGDLMPLLEGRKVLRFQRPSDLDRWMHCLQK